MNTIVMTGGTSGIGAVAAHALSGSEANRIVLGARGSRPEAIADRPNVAVLALDLASLDSVRRFADEVRARVDEIDALVLNAGVTRGDVDRRTVDGFETTFAINHLGHYLLLRLLRDRLAVGARVILTTSGAHNPAERTRFAPPRHADARLLAHPESDPDLDRGPLTAGGRAYAASKLCTMLTARAFTGQPDTVARGLIVVAYCPGETPGTGVARELPWPTRTMWRLLGTPLGRLVPYFTTRSAAGQALADLALGAVRPPDGHLYAALRRGHLTFPDPSELAARDDLATRLWHDSSRLVDIQPSTGSPIHHTAAEPLPGRCAGDAVAHPAGVCRVATTARTSGSSSTSPRSTSSCDLRSCSCAAGSDNSSRGASATSQRLHGARIEPRRAAALISRVLQPGHPGLLRAGPPAAGR